MLHSFFFPETIKAFSAVAETDPSCAIAYWGIAISQRPNPLVGPFDAATLKRGLEAVEKGKAIGRDVLPPRKIGDVGPDRLGDGAVVALAGRRIDAIDTNPPRSPLEAVPTVRRRLADLLAHEGARWRLSVRPPAAPTSSRSRRRSASAGGGVSFLLRPPRRLATSSFSPRFRQ
jgi:hypothetical protein